MGDTHSKAEGEGREPANAKNAKTTTAMSGGEKWTREELEALLAQTKMWQRVKDKIRAIANNTCGEAVDFMGASFDAVGARAVAEALKDNTCVKRLFLRDNSIGPEGAVALAEMLKHNTTITVLFLDSNSIGDEGAMALAEVLKHSTPLKGLYLGDNGIGDQGAVALMEMLKHNTTLEELFCVCFCCAGGSTAVCHRVLVIHSSLLTTVYALVDLPLLSVSLTHSLTHAHTHSPPPHTHTLSLVWCRGAGGDAEAQHNPHISRVSQTCTCIEGASFERVLVWLCLVSCAAGSTAVCRSPFARHPLITHHHRVCCHSPPSLSCMCAAWVAIPSAMRVLWRCLGSNGICDQGAVALAEMLKHNTAITRLRQQEADKAEKAAAAKLKQRQLQNAKETQPRPSSKKPPPTVPKPTKASHDSASAPTKQATLNPSSQSDSAAGNYNNTATATTGMSAEEMEKAIKEFNVDAVMGEGKARVTFKVFDLGGQSTFYIFHPFFLTKYAVYLLVFSMEDLLHQDKSKRAESWEFMEHWLSALHLHAKGAPVLIVGTFADKINERKQHEQISRDIYSRLRHNPAFPGVVHNDKHGLWFWPVDNTKSINDPMIQDLRQSISSTALAQEYVSQEVAVPYLHLYDKLMALSKDDKRPLLTFDEVVDIGRTCGLRTREETRACLQFLHLYSMVLYYDSVPGMEDYVILSPQWAVDTMTRVIRNFDLHHDVRDGAARAIGAQLWDDLVDRGILHRRLLDVLWRGLEGGMVEPFLQLMMEYGLCIQYTAPMVLLPGPQQQQQHHQQYLVPAILPMTLEDEQASSSVTLSTAAAQQANPYVGYEEKTAYVAFSLREFKRGVSAKIADTQQASFLPEGLFPMVLARVMAHMQHGATEPPMLSRTDAVIFMDAAEIEMQLVPAVGGIKIKVMTARPRTLLHMLYDTITTAVMQRYPELKATLDSNSIGDEGAMALAEVLKHSTPLKGL
ncbi:hypothetical protein PTSG_13066 [Salpingoeca rosetta]|uniref:COR domain-containing protein n=1 Tax=Salpingoeca rosetta (strain ATCC 50818 / BSB-021) TaxID=946362 RepID=F2URL7_SALR5|nr:uncharacterized protein PTSG_13066 [Salpingoeca rosetta]EGD80272.1 hypothetical protein PTSG_13066 [Salpingoeca rosetta]|eukprot:XP_004988062.1 hypothetical protein PTSG_13066 [Salpingoeca rosetta]